MIKEHIIFFRRLEIFADAAIAAVVYYVSGAARQSDPSLLILFALTWCALLHLQGMYASFRLKRIEDVLLTILAAACFGVALFSAGAHLFSLAALKRRYVLGLFFGAALLTAMEKIAAVLYFRYIRKKGYNFRNVLIVGTGDRAGQFIRLLRQRPDWGLRVIGLIDQDERLRGAERGGYPVLGTLADVPDIVHHNVIDEVVFFVPRSWLSEVEQLCLFCEVEGIRTHIGLDFFELKFARARQTAVENFLLLSFERSPMRVGALFLKAALDAVLAGSLLIVLLPLFAAVGTLIRRDSPGPVFYRQKRCGLNGRIFTLYKFRTMVKNAEALLPQLSAANEMQGPVFKLSADPRITRLGRFLRKYSIDELPQLWNVMRGDMSLVGPRPPLPAEVKKYDNWQRRRLSMRPGLTCFWQVQGRNTITDFNEWARLDLQYIDQWSLITDLRILLKTVPVVLFGIGAK